MSSAVLWGIRAACAYSAATKIKDVYDWWDNRDEYAIRQVVDAIRDARIEAQRGEPVDREMIKGLDYAENMITSCDPSEVTKEDMAVAKAHVERAQHIAEAEQREAEAA
jgi:hypothetical protein